MVVWGLWVDGWMDEDMAKGGEAERRRRVVAIHQTSPIVSGCEASLMRRSMTREWIWGCHTHNQDTPRLLALPRLYYHPLDFCQSYDSQPVSQPVQPWNEAYLAKGLMAEQNMAASIARVVTCSLFVTMDGNSPQAAALRIGRLSIRTRDHTLAGCNSVQFGRDETVCTYVCHVMIHLYGTVTATVVSFLQDKATVSQFELQRERGTVDYLDYLPKASTQVVVPPRK